MDTLAELREQYDAVQQHAEKQRHITMEMERLRRDQAALDAVMKKDAAAVQLQLRPLLDESAKKLETLRSAAADMLESGQASALRERQNALQSRVQSLKADLSLAERQVAEIAAKLEAASAYDAHLQQHAELVRMNTESAVVADDNGGMVVCAGAEEAACDTTMVAAAAVGKEKKKSSSRRKRVAESEDTGGEPQDVQKNSAVAAYGVPKKQRKKKPVASVAAIHTDDGDEDEDAGMHEANP